MAYSYTTEGIRSQQCKEKPKELNLIPREMCSEKELSLLAIVALTLLPCKLDFEEDVSVCDS